MDFIQEAETWLKPFGYAIHALSGDYKSAVFINTDVEHSPAIRCWVDSGGKKHAKIYDSMPYKMFLTLSTGDIQFKHPDLQKYIDVFRHYGKLAETHKPW